MQSFSFKQKYVNVDVPKNLSQNEQRFLKKKKYIPYYKIVTQYYIYINY